MNASRDNEFAIAMEMAMLASKNPTLSPDELRQMAVSKAGGKNEFQDQVDAKKQQKAKESTASSWWQAATKKATEMKQEAEKHLYADQIKEDPQVIETKKKLRILRKTLKAHRLAGNRVETRHTFKRTRMEKNLISLHDKLVKTQKIFTTSGFNVQEYMKSMMKASKKWRKPPSNDEELLLEAQLCRNMHQMLVLEKQKVKSKKYSKETKKYLQRCKGWVNDKKGFFEMNLMTVKATQNSLENMMVETIQRQDALIEKLKKSDEFRGVELDLDVSIVLPKILQKKDPERSAQMEAMRGLPILDSVRKAKQEKQQQSRGPEVYVETKDDVSVSSHLSDPDGEVDDNLDDSEHAFGADAPWHDKPTTTTKPMEEEVPSTEEDSPATEEEAPATEEEAPATEEVVDNDKEDDE